MYPIYAEIRKPEKESAHEHGEADAELEASVTEWRVGDIIVQLAVTADFSDKTGHSECCELWKTDKRHAYLLSDLVFQKAWMFHHALVDW